MYSMQIGIVFRTPESEVQRTMNSVTVANATDEKEGVSMVEKPKLLPAESLAPSEPNFYDWKEITGEFLDAVKGSIHIIRPCICTMD